MSGTAVAPGTPTGGGRLVPYEFARHGLGPRTVVDTVWREYGWEVEDEWDYDIVRPDLHYAPGWFMVAEDDRGKVVGCIGLSDDGEGVYHLNRLYVLAETRRQGLGRELVEWVIAESRARGARRIVLFSDIAFLDAHRLYERCGFRRNRFRYAPDHYESREWGFVLDLEEN